MQLMLLLPVTGVSSDLKVFDLRGASGALYDGNRVGCYQKYRATVRAAAGMMLQMVAIAVVTASSATLVIPTDCHKLVLRTPGELTRYCLKKL